MSPLIDTADPNASSSGPYGSASGPPAYPTRGDHALAWHKLASEIAASEADITDAPLVPTETPGELIVIGSGIETVGFALGDEALLRTADEVFFCVADPATVVWIKSIRPDALDLYVLYDDSKVRYTTYMQMTEAMLHGVRRGRRVVAIYYGHPGIFVLSTHRAILVARREGHRATMRSSVSALDCLCADLGVDPCHPGMQTHEATDMLIRGRSPDTNLHVVLWQVGLIGEMGFRRKGYLNANFSVLIEYLQKHYGDDYPMTHYVASRYPTIPPIVETHPLSAYHDPAVAARVTGISTVYLAPRDDATADRAMLERLGMIQPGQEVKPSTGPLREIGKYGARERKAFRAFRRFDIPKGYHWQEDTAGGRFLIALRDDPDLQKLYAEAPTQAVDQACPGIGADDRRLLASRDPGGIQIAAKGSRQTDEANRDFYRDLLRSKRLQRSLLALVRNARGDLQSELRRWPDAIAYPVDWDRLRADVDVLQRNRLFPWTGIYATAAPAEGGATPQHLLAISTAGKRARIWLDGRQLRRVAFRHGVLEWQANRDDEHHGFLRVDHDARGRRRLLGSIWPAGEAVPASFGTELAELAIPATLPSALVGRYVDDARPDRLLEIDVAVSTDGDGARRGIEVRLDGEPLPENVAASGALLTVGDRRFPLAFGGPKSPQTPAWRAQDVPAPAYRGSFAFRTLNQQWTCTLSAGGVLIDGIEPGSVTTSRNSVSWKDGPPAAPRGTFHFLLNPLTLHPVAFGTADTAPLSGAACYAAASVPAGTLVDAGPLGLDRLAGDALTATAILSGRGGFPLWQEAEKAARGSLLAVQALMRHLP